MHMQNLFKFSRLTLAALALIIAGAQSVAAATSTGITVKESVELAFRWVTLKNFNTKADELVPMWTFVPLGTKSSEMTQKYPYTGVEDPKSSFPGPLLVAREGDAVEFTFKNTCPCEWRRVDHPYSGHTIHLHGLDQSTKTDGVAETSFSVLPNQSFTYKLRTHETGTYIYHCHIHTVLHQNMGMYGGIILMPTADSDQNRPFAGGPTFTKQYYWVVAEADRNWHVRAVQKQGYGDFGDNDEFTYFTRYNPEHFVLASFEIDLTKLNSGGPGRGLVWRTNPTPGPISARIGDTLLIRVGNLGYLNQRVSFAGLPFDAVATDGRPMRDVSGNLAPMLGLTSMDVAPGERYDFILKLPVAGTITSKIEYLNPYKKVVAGSVTQDIVVQ